MANRYKGVKGKFWKVFAVFIRLRDSQKYGTCIACNRKKPYEELQAGHYLAAGNCGFSLLFDEENVNGECPYDNAYNKNHQMESRENLIKRIGQSRVEDLERRYRDAHYGGRTTKEWSKKEYEAKIAEYVEKTAQILSKNDLQFTVNEISKMK